MAVLTPSVSRHQSVDGLVFYQVEHPLCRARIYEQGAHITAFQARGQAPMLWVSEDEDYLPGKAIRGGIPICWPWFGPHPEGEAGAHGVARTREWQLKECQEHHQGVALTFQFSCGPEAGVRQPLSATLRFQLGASLGLTLTSENKGTEAVDLSLALHTYFPVGDIHRTQLRGAAGRLYDDMLTAQKGLSATSDELCVGAETDRIYYGDSTWLLSSPDLAAAIDSTGSRSTVVWNPWIEKSQRLSNFHDEDYLRMLCVETANCGADTRRLAPGESHTTAVTYRYRPALPEA